MSNRQFYQQLVRPIPLDKDQLLTNKNQVAGHAGFYSLHNEPNSCLKPFNTRCVRGRREHLFYQLLEFIKRRTTSTNNYPNENTQECQVLYYKNFTLLTYPSPATKCHCVVDENLFRLLSSFVANFYHVKHLTTTSEISQTKNQLLLETDDENLQTIYSEELTCPCYGRDQKKKSSCSKDYEKTHFLCLEDLTAHCHQPCIIDIKIGQITYDPMAIKEKVVEQSNKYRRLREFGFRILGMKLGEEIKDKTFGKTLETSEQVFDALKSFLVPLESNHYRYIVSKQITKRLQELLSWFENHNINQLKFFSSSLLIVYDSKMNKGCDKSEVDEELIKSIRVSMIDFAHVFHVHNSDCGDHISTLSHQHSGHDDNYIFGLKKLEQFFNRLNQYHHHQNHPHPSPPHPPLG